MKPVIPQAPSEPEYSMRTLVDYIMAAKEIRDRDLKEIEVSQKFLDWYNEQTKIIAKNFNIPTTKNYKEPSYMGVKLVVK